MGSKLGISIHISSMANSVTSAMQMFTMPEHVLSSRAVVQHGARSGVCRGVGGLGAGGVGAGGLGAGCKTRAFVDGDFGIRGRET